MITMMSNAVIPALASEGSADDPYKLILTEEPKPSSGSRKAAGEAAAAAAAEQAAQTEGSDTSDPYKGGGDNSDPYKGTGGVTTATRIREPAATAAIRTRGPAVIRAIPIREPAAEMPARRPQRNPLRMRRTMFPSPAQTRSIR